jgi:hypothetical protein
MVATKEQASISDRLTFSSASVMSVVYWKIDTYRIAEKYKITWEGHKQKSIR